MESFHYNFHGILIWFFNGKENQEAGIISFELKKKTKKYDSIIQHDNWRNQDQNYYSMKAYNLGNHYQQKFKSPLSNITAQNLQKLFSMNKIMLHNIHI